MTLFRNAQDERDGNLSAFEDRVCISVSDPGVDEDLDLRFCGDAIVNLG